MTGSGTCPPWCGWTGPDVPKKRYPAWTYRQERAYRGNMALHDILPAEATVWPVGADFRQPDIATVPYWDPQGLATHDHKDLKITAWKGPGRCCVLLVNVGPARLEAKVRLDRQAMGFGAGSPDEVKIMERDPDLLTYFREDPTTAAAPSAPDAQADVLAEATPELHLEERSEDLPLAQRRAQDPDGKFGWQGGVLTCPVRRHDYRVFLFTKP